MVLAEIVTTNRNTLDALMIIAAVLFFLAALLHLLRPPLAVFAMVLGFAGACALAIGIMFI